MLHPTVAVRLKPTPNLSKLPACGAVFRWFCDNKLRLHPVYLHLDTSFPDDTKLLDRLYPQENLGLVRGR